MRRITGKQHILPLAHPEPPARPQDTLKGCVRRVAAAGRQALGVGSRPVPGGRFSPADVNRSQAVARRALQCTCSQPVYGSICARTRLSSMA
jgi:hypothetical protein